MHDLTITFRILRRSPVTAALAAATLALGACVTIAIFTVVHGVMLRGLPYPDADRLVLIWQGVTTDPARRGPLSPPDLGDIREQATGFSHVVGINSFSTTFLPEGGDPEQVEMGVVAGDLFAAMRVSPFLGRVLEPGDDRPLNTRDSTAVGVIVLGHEFWETRFGGDRSIVGRTIRLGANPLRVVGVLPASFALHMPRGSGMATDLIGWTPLGIDVRAAPRDGAYLKAVARLKPDVPYARAQAEVDAIAARLRAAVPRHEDVGFRLRVAPLEGEVVAHVRPILLILAVSGALVLLVACANVATLLLVRFMARQQEVAIRGALGADRTRLVRPLLLESALVSIAGTVAGVLLAMPAIRLLLRLEPGIVPRAGVLEIDGAVIAPAAALAVLLTLVCGFGPALVITRGDQSALLRSQRAGGAPGAFRLRRGVIIAQAAVTFALVYASATLVGTLLRLQRADVGFEPAGVTTFSVTLPFARYRGPDTWVDFFERLTARLAAVPGVSAAAATSDLPMAGTQSLEPYAPEHDRGERPWGASTALYRIVSPGYFAAAGIPVPQGRDFGPADRGDGVFAAAVDETLARTLAAARPGPVLGRRIDVTVHEFRGGYRVSRRTAEIVGVVGTVAHEHPDARPPGTIYLPMAQHPLWSFSIVLRGRGGVAPAIPAARAALADLDARLPMHGVRPMTALVDGALAPTRFLLALVGVFAVTVVGLTAAGLFGIVAEEVRQRRSELAVRLALGAAPRLIAATMLRRGLVLVAIGVVPGVVLAIAGGPLLARGLAGGFETSPGALAVAAVALFAIAAAACCVPSWRAGRVDPIAALRGE